MTDLISRQAAIDAMSCINDSICEGQAIDALSELPTIDPAENGGCWGCCCEKLGQVKHGKWKVCCYQNKKCSECGYIIGDDDAEEFHYCPNCGSFMGEEDE